MIRTEEFELSRERPGARGKKPLVVRGEAYHPEKTTGIGSQVPTVVICHGFKGFAHWAFFPYVARSLAENGMRAITFDFSGSGVGPDRENFTTLEEFETNTFTQELSDLDEVLAEARRREWIAAGFGLFGHSRGGGVAILHAASDPDVKALVTWAAISKVRRWSDEEIKRWRERGYSDVINSRTGQTMRVGTAILDEIESLEKTKLDIPSAARRISVPWLIVHGDADETVPAAEAERLADLSPGAGMLWKVEGGSHAFGASHPVKDPPPMLALVVRGTVGFFAEHLARATV
ncbi:MAG TPA: alpha/beta fold hydrolase [Gemmatimonadaceae bacterium]|nr:alpha/beta fold hydrolase [Gemmatimonadaceae bacterium]